MNTIILDLDETLVHTLDSQKESKKFDRNPDYEFSDCIGYIRPFYSKFLKYIFKNWQVIVWTAGKKCYADEIVDAVFHKHSKELKLVLNKSNCSNRLENVEGYYYAKVYYKPLPKLENLNLDLKHTLIIDDRTDTAYENIDNLILMPRFYKDDDYLLKLLNYLKKMNFQKMDDVRSIDKTTWFLE